MRRLAVREQLGRLETEERMALWQRDYARATEIANRRIRLEALRPARIRVREGRVVA